MDKKFYNKIINLLPSADLKKCIKEQKFTFGEKELLKFISEYSPTFYVMLSLIKEAEQKFCDKNARAHAKKLYDFKTRMQGEFMRAGDGFIYDIKFLFPNTDCAQDDDTYVAKNFDEALEYIKFYAKYYYKKDERKGMRATVSKKSLNVPKRGSDFDKCRAGTVGKCVVDEKLNIIYLNMDSFGYEVPCKNNRPFCNECRRCVTGIDPHYPPFLKKYDLVAYYDDLLYRPDNLKYGVFCADMEKYDDDSYVCLLEDNEYVQNRNGDFIDENGYYRIYDDHWHPSLAEIIKPALDTVPEKVYQDYLYAVECLKNSMNWIKLSAGPFSGRRFSHFLAKT